MTDLETTPAQESQIEYIVDTRGISYSDAERIVIGKQPTLSQKSPHVRRPRRYPLPGHVQDFEGRRDEYRGGVQQREWLSDEQKEINQVGVEAVRRVLGESTHKATEPTEDELSASRDAEVARIKQRVAEP